MSTHRMQAAVMMRDFETEADAYYFISHACEILILAKPSPTAALPLQAAAAGAARSTPPDDPPSDDDPHAVDWGPPGSLPNVPEQSISLLEYTLWYRDASPEALYLRVRLFPAMCSRIAVMDAYAPAAASPDFIAALLQEPLHCHGDGHALRPRSQRCSLMHQQDMSSAAALTDPLPHPAERFNCPAVRKPTQPHNVRYTHRCLAAHARLRCTRPRCPLHPRWATMPRGGRQRAPAS